MSATLTRKVHQAAAALAEGDPARAERLCREVLERAPRHPQALQVAAAARLQQEDGAGAGELLRRALADDPRNPQLLEGLGAAALKAGKFAEAESWLRRALELAPGNGAACAWLGIALASQGRHAEAEGFFRRALTADPANPGHWVNLGNTERLQGRHGQAQASYRRALDLAPGHLDALLGLGQALEHEGRIAESAAAYQRALEFAPGNAGARYRLGVVLNLSGEHGRSAQHLEAVLADRPDHLDALNELGIALQELGRLEDAERCFRGALEREGANPGWHSNLGNALYVQGRYVEAAAAFENAVALEPGSTLALGMLGLIRVEQGQAQAGKELIGRAMRSASGEARGWWDLGNALQEAGQYADAEACHRKALALQPDYADAEMDLGVVLLYQGKFPEGWRRYEKRFDTLPPRAARKVFSSPRATPEALQPGAGKLAVWAEQGLGDEIIYSSLIPELAARGVDFVCEIDRRLLPLYRRSFPGASFVPRQDTLAPELAAAAWNIAAGSLPGLLRTCAEDFCSQPKAFLVPDRSKTEAFKSRLQASGRAYCIALSWRSAGRRRVVQRKKSADLTAFAPLARVPDVRLVDVQYGDTGAERAAFEQSTGCTVQRLADVDHFNDLESVFAIIAACDLVITTSNVTAHFAGAIGKAAWLLFPGGRAPFHYWVPGPDGRSLWYPSVEIVSAPQLGDWGSLAEYAAERLRKEWPVDLGRA